VAFKGNDPCYDKAAPDEPIFTLRAQDVLAPGIVEAWAQRAEKAGSPPEKVAEARDLAEQMRQWQKQHPCKTPD